MNLDLEFLGLVRLADGDADDADDFVAAGSVAVSGNRRDTVCV